MTLVFCPSPSYATRQLDGWRIEWILPCNQITHRSCQSAHVLSPLKCTWVRTIFLTQTSFELLD